MSSLSVEEIMAAQEARGLRVKRARQAKHPSLRGFAYAIGISPSVMSDIEKHGYIPRADVQARIAEALGVSISDLWPPTQS